MAKRKSPKFKSGDRVVYITYFRQFSEEYTVLSEEEYKEYSLSTKYQTSLETVEKTIQQIKARDTDPVYLLSDSDRKKGLLPGWMPAKKLFPVGKALTILFKK